MPRVSVILPNYNYARYLKERVRSILQQSMTDFELIYLDDASTDCSNEMMRAFAGDPRVQMHCFESNSGKVYQRWNDGAALATGEWLWFAGADDSVTPTFLERLLAMAEAHPTVGILHCLTIKMDSEGRCVEYGHKPCPRQSQSHVASGVAEHVFVSLQDYLFTASSILLRRDLFEAAGRFDTRLWVAADWNLYLKLLRKGDIGYVAEPLAYYRVHGTTVTNSVKSMVRHIEEAYCMADAYLSMVGDARFADGDREKVLVALKLKVFDTFAVPFSTIPANLRFAVETIYQAVPDRRLLRRLEKTAGGAERT